MRKPAPMFMCVGLAWSGFPLSEKPSSCCSVAHPCSTGRLTVGRGHCERERWETMIRLMINRNEEYESNMPPAIKRTSNHPCSFCTHEYKDQSEGIRTAKCATQTSSWFVGDVRHSGCHTTLVLDRNSMTGPMPNTASLMLGHRMERPKASITNTKCTIDSPSGWRFWNGFGRAVKLIIRVSNN